MYKFEPIKIAQIFGFEQYRVNGDNLMTECPFSFKHEKMSDHHFSFGVNLQTGEWNCFSCFSKGQSIRSLSSELEIDLPNEILMESFDIPLQKKEKTKLTFSNHFPFNAKGALEKLAHRGVSMEAILKTEVTYMEDEDKLIFPCKDPHGQMTSWVVRSDRLAGRYGFFPEGASRNFALFGMVSTSMKKVFLCEGPVDALKLISFGLNGVATCGDLIFEEQANAFLDYADSICLVPDIDNSGRNWFKKALKLFKGKLPLSYILVPPQYKDVGHEAVTKEVFMNLKENLA